MNCWWRNLAQDIQHLKFGDVAESAKGKKPKKHFTENTHGLIPYIDIQAFEEGRFNSYTDGKGCLLCKDGDILLVWDGSRSGLVGKAYGGAVGSTIAKIKSSFIDKNFIYYYLLSKYQAINTRAKGTGTPHVDPDLLWGSAFPIFSNIEQDQIVGYIEELFSDLDNAIENLKKAQEQLKVYRQAVLNKATIGKDSVHLGDLIEQPKYGSSRKCSKYPVGKAVLRIPNIGNQYVDSTNLKYARFSDDEASKYSIKEGDLLIIRSNGSVSLVGKTAIVSKKDTDALYAGYLIRLRPNANLNSHYAFYVLSSPQLRNQIEFKAKSTSGVHNINSDEIKSLRVPFCSPKEQLKIVEEIESRFSVCDQLEQTIETNLQKAESLRQSILKQAFEGKLTERWRKEHKDLISGENSAEALLKRIMSEKDSVGADLCVRPSNGEGRHAGLPLHCNSRT